MNYPPVVAQVDIHMDVNNRLTEVKTEYGGHVKDQIQMSKDTSQQWSLIAEVLADWEVIPEVKEWALVAKLDEFISFVQQAS